MIADGANNTLKITGGSRPRDRRNYCARTLGRECGGYNTRKGKKPASTCETLLAPGTRAARGEWPNKPITGTEMDHSPYLDKPFVPLAVALRSMLAETEAKMVTAAPAERARLQERAEVLREWLTLRSTTPVST